MVIAVGQLLVATLLQAGAQVWVSQSLSAATSLLYTLVGFLVTAAAMGLLRAVARARAVPRRPRRWVLFALMNLATAVAFVSQFTSLAFVSAAWSSSLAAAAAPLVILLADHLRGGRPRPADWATLVLLVASVTLLGWRLAPTGDPGQSPDFWIGSVLAVLAGIGFGFVGIHGKALADAGETAVTVTAHRFHLTYLLAAAIFLVTSGPTAEPVAVTWAQLGTMALVGLLCLAVPLVLLQRAIQGIGPLAVVAVNASLPAVTYLMQGAVGAPIDPLTTGVVAVVVMIAALHAVRTARRAARAAAPTAAPPAPAGGSAAGSGGHLTRTGTARDHHG